MIHEECGINSTRMIGKGVRVIHSNHTDFMEIKILIENYLLV